MCGMTLSVISLGAGVQSTTMALLAAHGEVTPMPDCAIFADTGSEPAAVYEHLRWLREASVLPFPIHVVSVGNLGAEILSATRGESKRGSHARPPFFVKNQDGSRGVVRRQCTGDYKIAPIERKLRELIGLKSRQRWPKERLITQWLGISTGSAPTTRRRCVATTQSLRRARPHPPESRRSRSNSPATSHGATFLTSGNMSGCPTAMRS